MGKKEVYGYETAPLTAIYALKRLHKTTEKA